MSALSLDAYRQVFRVRPFRTFWLGFTFSVFGDTLTRVALTWYVYERTGSSEALGLLAFCYTAPVVVGGLAAGWLLDRFDRRRVMIFDNLLRGLAVALIPLLDALGMLELWHVYAAAAIYGGLMMISLAGGPSLVPSLVEGESLATANALETLSFTLGGVIGPPLAGVLIGWMGATNVVLPDALSYLLFALALAGIRLPRGQSQPRAHPAEGQGIGAAVRLLVREPVLLSTTLMYMTLNVGFGMLLVWVPIYADRVLGGGPELYGSLLGAMAVGEVVSSLLAGGWKPRLPLGILIISGAMLAGLSLGLVVLGAWWIAGGLALVGFFSAPLTIWAQTLRMQIIPEDLRGRTFALLRTMMMGTVPLGGAAAGFLLPALGMGAMVGLTAALYLMPGLAGLSVRELRKAGPPSAR